MGKMWGMKGPCTPFLKMGNYATELTVDPDPLAALCDILVLPPFLAQRRRLERED